MISTGGLNEDTGTQGLWDSHVLRKENAAVPRERHKETTEDTRP